MTAKAPASPTSTPEISALPERAARTRGQKAQPQGFDMEVLGRMEWVSPPKQARSEQSLQRVLSSLESLLKNKPFAEISIPEISLDSKCSTATIYSRFRDKNSILAALHESRRDRMMRSIQEELTPQRWAGRTLDELVSTYAARIVNAYGREHNLYFAALTMGDKDIYERGAQSIAFAQECFTNTLPVLKDPPRNIGNLPLAIRTIFALVQQRTIFSGVSLVESDNLSPDEAIVQDVALLVRAFKAIMA